MKVSNVELVVQNFQLMNHPMYAGGVFDPLDLNDLQNEAAPSLVIQEHTFIWLCLVLQRSPVHLKTRMYGAMLECSGPFVLLMSRGPSGAVKLKFWTTPIAKNSKMGYLKMVSTQDNPFKLDTDKIVP